MKRPKGKKKKTREQREVEEQAAEDLVAERRKRAPVPGEATLPADSATAPAEHQTAADKARVVKLNPAPKSSAETPWLSEPDENTQRRVVTKSGKYRVVVVRPGYMAHKLWKVNEVFTLTVKKDDKFPSWLVPETEWEPPKEPDEVEAELEGEVVI